MSILTSLYLFLTFFVFLVFFHPFFIPFSSCSGSILSAFSASALRARFSSRCSVPSVFPHTPHGCGHRHCGRAYCRRSTWMRSTEWTSESKREIRKTKKCPKLTTVVSFGRFFAYSDAKFEVSCCGHSRLRHISCVVDRKYHHTPLRLSCNFSQ